MYPPHGGPRRPGTPQPYSRGRGIAPNASPPRNYPGYPHIQQQQAFNQPSFEQYQAAWDDYGSGRGGRGRGFGQGRGQGSHGDERRQQQGCGRKNPYEPYWSQEDALAALLAGKLKRGALRVNAGKSDDAYVHADEDPDLPDIFIKGRSDRNRAVNGDIVYIELYDRSKWVRVSDKYKTVEETLASAAQAGVDVPSPQVPSREPSSAADENDSGGELHPTGKVVYIEDLSGTNRVYVATLKANRMKKQGDSAEPSPPDDEITLDDKMIKAVPMDKRVPWMLLPIKEIQQAPEVRQWLQVPGKIVGTLLWPVQIDKWEENAPLPKGRIVGGPIGNAGEIETEARLCMMEAELEDHMDEFSDEVAEETKRVLEWAKATHEAEVNRRVDLREARIMTIDPATARDLDDAIHIVRDDSTSPPQFEIGVHIADVSHFVWKGHKIDSEAAWRCTTVYLTHRAYHMLPRELCSDLCSLNPREEKLTYTAIFRLHEDGTRVESFKPKFFKSVIRSCCRWNYDQVQVILDGNELEPKPEVYNGHSFEACCVDLRVLEDLTQKIRKRRFKDGSLALNKTKIRFTVDYDTKVPTSYDVESHSSSHELIEELMLLANTVVAEKLVESPLRECGVLRRHPWPLSRQLLQLKAFLDGLGITADFGSAGGVYRTIKKVWLKFGYFVSQAVEVLLMKPMKPAEYFTYGTGKSPHHYALHFPLYTHFTSPIRRYADVMVHRLLTATLAVEAGLATLSDTKKTKTEEGNEANEAAKAASIPALAGGDKKGAAYTVKFSTSLAPGVDPVAAGLDFDQNELQKQCDLCNEKKLQSKKAQEDCDRAFFCIWLRGLDVPCTSLATVMLIQDKSVVCYVPQLGKEKRLCYDTSTEASMQASNIYEKFKNVPVFPKKYKLINKHRVEAEWELPELALGARPPSPPPAAAAAADGGEETTEQKEFTQIIKMFSKIPVYILPTSTVPIDFVLVPVPPYQHTYKELLKNDKERMAELHKQMRAETEAEEAMAGAELTDLGGFEGADAHLVDDVDDEQVDEHQYRLVVDREATERIVRHELGAPRKAKSVIVERPDEDWD
ncbi:unnamed protein product [Vitrella brassicaformis CCMP3155]|uniref:RNB domain-containing protein n=4 Tax=Vitrella brassicaformis TaxID=1169539 RepID=A0A0G4F9T0_VITBC|nr:unnamed protein product [Vitrella brassicaformis CCMP3155]|eukprot:CEM09140.1 unnamed protein product [Vitrella brassicaformis CCMP3155]